MEVTAQLNHLRIAPRKVRLIADLIRGKSVEEAQIILTFAVKKAAPSLLKLLKSAVANAKENFHLEEKNLFILKIIVNEGQKLKRWRPASRGSTHPIIKRTSNVTIVLDETPKESRRLPTGQVVKKSKKVKRVKKPTVRTQLKEEKIEKVKKALKIEKPKLRPKMKRPEPRPEKGVKRIFRRKAF